MRFVIAAGFVLVGIGCFSPTYRNGDIPCSSSGQCPSGFHCATTNTCWANGQDPGPADAGVPDDMAQQADGGLPPPDLSPPADFAPVVFPPASVWISGGGGSMTAASGTELNFSIGGTSINGTSTAPSGADVTFGFLNNDTY